MVGKGLHTFLCVILFICVILVFSRASRESGPHFVCTNNKQTIYSPKPTCFVVEYRQMGNTRWDYLSVLQENQENQYKAVWRYVCRCCCAGSWKEDTGVAMSVVFRISSSKWRSLECLVEPVSLASCLLFLQHHSRTMSTMSKVSQNSWAHLVAYTVEKSGFIPRPFTGQSLSVFSDPLISCFT